MISWRSLLCPAGAVEITFSHYDLFISVPCVHLLVPISHVDLPIELFLFQVFTCLSLFLMLISPLNAFPWVINGLVEAWVSLKRVHKFVCLKDTDPGHYYTSDAGNCFLSFSVIPTLITVPASWGNKGMLSWDWLLHPVEDINWKRKQQPINQLWTGLKERKEK